MIISSWPWPTLTWGMGPHLSWGLWHHRTPTDDPVSPVCWGVLSSSPADGHPLEAVETKSSSLLCQPHLRSSQMNCFQTGARQGSNPGKKTGQQISFFKWTSLKISTAPFIENTCALSLFWMCFNNFSSQCTMHLTWNIHSLFTIKVILPRHTLGKMSHG